MLLVSSSFSILGRNGARSGIFRRARSGIFSFGSWLASLICLCAWYCFSFLAPNREQYTRISNWRRRDATGPTPYTSRMEIRCNFNEKYSGRKMADVAGSAWSRGVEQTALDVVKLWLHTKKWSASLNFRHRDIRRRMNRNRICRVGFDFRLYRGGRFADVRTVN